MRRQNPAHNAFYACFYGAISTLVDDKIFPGLVEVTSTHTHICTYGSARVEWRKRIDVFPHSGLEMRVQEIPGVRALRNISSRSILHFLRLTFLTPTLMRYSAANTYVLPRRTGGFPSAQNVLSTGKAIDHSRRRRTQDRGKGSRQVDSI